MGQWGSGAVGLWGCGVVGLWAVGSGQWGRIVLGNGYFRDA